MHEVVLFGDGEAAFENVDRRREVTAKDVHVAEEGVGDRQAGRVADVRRDLQTFGCGCERGIEASEGRSRFKLGDVVRFAIDPNGNLTVDDVAKHWDVPTEAARFNRGINGGWSIDVPAGVNQKDIDPIKELSRQFDPLPEDAKPLRYIADTTFWLVPRDQVLNAGAASITPEQNAHAQVLADRLQQA